MVDAEMNSRSEARAFVGYEAVLRDWRGEFTRIGVELGFEWPIGLEAAAADIDG
jgi:hypothetical protein